MRVLILGATGQIGSHVAAACADRRWPHLGTWYRHPHAEFAPLDLRDGEAVDDLIEDYQPDLTVLAAGVADAGYAEQFAQETDDVNVAGAVTVADAVARTGGSLLLFSADTLFGDCPTARREEDPVTPAGVFATGKAVAEAMVRRALPGRHLILRTGWVYGPDERDRGLAGSLVRRLASGDPVAVASDRFGQPTYAPDLAAVALDLGLRGETGTWHAVGPEKHTEATFARLVAHLWGFDVDLLDIQPAAALDDGDPRPGRVWLDRFKLRSALGAKAIRTPAEGLRAIRAGRATVRLAAA